MKVLARDIGLIITLVVIFGVCGCSSAKPTEEKIKASIKNIMPANYQLISVNILKEVPGLLEVVVKMDNNTVVLYMDEKAQYLFSGSLIHVASKKNLTIEAQQRSKQN